MATNCEYLSYDNLHFKPLNVMTFRGFMFISTELSKHASPDRWHGHVLRFLSKTLTIATCATHIPFAMVDSLFFGILAGGGYAFRSLTNSKSEILQKYTVRSLAHCIHSFEAVILYFVLLFNKVELKSHTVIQVVDHLMHIGTASFIQLTFGHHFDIITGRYIPPVLPRRPAATPAATAADLPPSQQRTISMIISALPRATDSLFHAISLDFSHQNVQILRLRAALREVAPNLFQQLTLDTLVNRERRNLWLQQFINALVAQGVIPAPVPGEEHIMRLNTLANNEADYQKHLQNRVKQSWIEIYNTDALVQCLSEKNVPISERVQNGKDALSGFYATTYIPVANYTQYKELLDAEVKCPAVFESQDLRQYNNRLQKITEAKTKLQALTPVEKETLVKKLLLGDDLNLATSGHNAEKQADIQLLFKSVVDLAGTLHQGKLMSQAAINLTTGEADYRNLFQQGCQEAANSLPQT
jgi:hypothetical protein